MASNPYVNKVVFGGDTLIDISDSTAVASDVAQGKYFYLATGEKVAGTSTGGGGSGDGYVWQDQDGYVHLSDEGSEQITVEALSVTQNGTYTAPTGTAYSPVTVNVSGGGGGDSTSKKQINFIDYDGKILHSYTKTEWQSVSALPSNPSHTGLTSQGWNWTKAQIDAQLTAMPDGDVWVGQMYVTTSGDTEIDVLMQEDRLSPTLTIAVNGTVSVDWGDNTTTDTVTGSSLTTRQAAQHTYDSAGDYTIKIHTVSGTFSFYGSSTYLLLRKNTTGNENRVYANCVQSVRLGSGITSIGEYAFYYCRSLASVSMHSGVTSIGSNAFNTCSSLDSVTIPSDVASISNAIFSTCHGLASVTMPNNVTSIGNDAFSNCQSLASVAIPSGVTSIGSNAFSTCNSLASVSIPSGVTSIGNSAFTNCYGIAKYHIKPNTPPTLGTTVFNNIVSDCVIYVPTAKLNDYQTASNWSTYASKMQGE